MFSRRKHYSFFTSSQIYGYKYQIYGYKYCSLVESINIFSNGAIRVFDVKSTGSFSGLAF